MLTKFSLCVILFKRREQSEYSSGASKKFFKKIKKSAWQMIEYVIYSSSRLNEAHDLIFEKWTVYEVLENENWV